MASMHRVPPHVVIANSMRFKPGKAGSKPIHPLRQQIGLVPHPLGQSLPAEAHRPVLQPFEPLFDKSPADFQLVLSTSYDL